MRTPWVIGIVVAAHCAAVVGIVAIQGCGTPSQDAHVSATDEVIMPPTDVREAEPEPQPEPQPEVTAWPAATTEYAVKTGDTLSAIAARYGLSTKELAALNGLEKPDHIQVGQKLQLPGSVAVDKPVKKPVHPAVKKAAGNVYEVKSGDCLSKIAAAHGCSTKALIAANSLTGDKIFVGQKLVMPEGGAAPAPKPAPKKKPTPVDTEDPLLEGEPVDMLPMDAEPEVNVDDLDMLTYVIGDDEDLHSVAMRFHVSVTQLKEVNGLADGEVRPGQTIKIPVAD